MAFMAMVIVAIVGGIFLIFLFLMLLFIILGIVKSKKKKKSAKVFFTLSGIIFALLAGFLLFLFGPRIREIDTPDKTVKVGEWITNDLAESIENEDIEQVEEMLIKRPELLYYVDINGQGILDKAALTGNVELVQCILNYGGKFDDPLIHEKNVYKYSLELYFHRLLVGEEGQKASEEGIAPMIECMLENGAVATFDGDNNTPNALWVALWWITQDNEISQDDIRVVELLIDYGASCTEKDYQGETVINLLSNEILTKSTSINDPEGFAKLRKIIETAAGCYDEREY